MNFLIKKNLTLLFLFVTGALAAQPALPADSSTVAIEDSVANSLLWAITGNELTDTSYLYGTIHLIGKEDFFLTKNTEKAFANSKKVTFEINMENMMDMGAQMSLMMKAFMNNGVLLSDLLEEQEYTIVKTHFEEMGMGGFIWNMMERIKPMFLSIFASMDMNGSGMGSGLQSGDMKSYEMEFMEMARSQNKEMDGLETAEYQMSMFDSIPYEAQAKMLYESIQTGDEREDDQLEEMVKLYKAQNLNGMMKMFAADKEGIGEYEDILLVGRNQNWIPIMVQMMADQPTFFAVGAGHLGGAQGVIRLLEKEGYELIPLVDVKAE